MTVGRRALVGSLSLLGMIAVWDSLGYWGILDAELFPPITRILARAWELIADGEFLTRDVLSSMKRLAAAAAISIPIAVIMGSFVATSAWVRAAVGPFINFTMPLPKVAIFPLMLAIFGVGDAGKIVLICIGFFYPLFVNVLNGMLKIRNSEYMDLAHVYGIHGKRLMWDIFAKGIRLDILSGLKTSFGYGFTLVVVSELTASQNGLGNFVWRSWDAYQILDMYAGIFWLCFLGWTVQCLLDWRISRSLKRS